MFPSDRFTQAGASAEQIAELQADFDALPEVAQQSYLDRIGGLAVGDLAEIVRALATPTAEPESVPGVEVTDEPLAGTGEAVNAQTGEVTPAGEPLPALPQPEPAAWAEDPTPEAPAA